MSMLAERKRKQKWSLNPRGNDWVQDSSKFGQKMLEKMGWQHGKGLGAKEDGITENIKVSYKNDSRGMGFKESNDQWTEHDANFSALLESLSGEKPKEVKLNSLEKKSQSSRARVHYHKFTRGKDLSRYSEKDLANIFGKKSLKEPSKSKVEAKEAQSEGGEEKNANKFLFNAGSMRDYFKKKLPSLGKSNGYVVGENGVLKVEESDSEINTRPSFSFNDHRDDEEITYAGFGFKSTSLPNTDADTVSKGKSTFVSYVNGESNEESSANKSKNKRKAEEKEVDNVFSSKKKSRKNKCESKSVTEAESNKGVANPAFNPLRTPVKIQKHVLDTIEESISEDSSLLEENGLECGVTTVQVHASSQKQKQHLSESTCSNVDAAESSLTSTGTKKKLKKSKGLKGGIVNDIFVVNESLDLSLNGGKENEVETSSFEVKRKENMNKKQKALTGSQEEMKTKKTKKKVTNSIDFDSSGIKQVYENPNFKETIEDGSVDVPIDENPYEVKPKKSKKMKKENPSVDLTKDDSGVSSLVEETPSKSKLNKKKSEKNYALENPNFVEEVEHTVDSTQIEENPYEVKVKKKKKGRDGIDNINFNEAEDSSNTPQNEENLFEVPRNKKNKKKNKSFAIENPNFNESLEEPISVEVKENPYEVKPKKKKKKDDSLAIDNPNFNTNDSIETSSENIVFEVQRKKKKEKKNKEKADNIPKLTSDVASSDVKETISLDIEESDLMLNVVTTPIVKKTQRSNCEENSLSVTRITSVKRRKSVRFSDVTQERVIPNNDDIRNLSDIENRNELFEINTRVINNSLEEQNISFDMSTLDKFHYNSGNVGKKKKLGLDNAAFDKRKANLEENLDSITRTIDRYEAEIENDINEKKLETFTLEDIMIGEVGNPHGEHEKLPGGTKLKFKYANFTSRSPFYHLDKTGSRKAYKHLIKGDIVVGFRNTNLHEIQGYASKNKSTGV